MKTSSDWKQKFKGGHYEKERNDILPLKDKLFRLALRITLDRAEAEDVVQDTMISCLLYTSSDDKFR